MWSYVRTGRQVIQLSKHCRFSFWRLACVNYWIKSYFLWSCILKFYGIFILFCCFFLSEASALISWKTTLRVYNIHSSISILCKTLLIVNLTKSAEMCHEKWCWKDNTEYPSNRSSWRGLTAPICPPFLLRCFIVEFLGIVRKAFSIALSSLKTGSRITVHFKI